MKYRRDLIPRICECLQAKKHRATYAALAGAIGYKGPNPGRHGGNWMNSLPQEPRHSWIVLAKKSYKTGTDAGLPSGYPPNAIDPNLNANTPLLSNGEDLVQWLNNSCPNWAGPRSSSDGLTPEVKAKLRQMKEKLARSGSDGLTPEVKARLRQMKEKLAKKHRS